MFYELLLGLRSFFLLLNNPVQSPAMCSTRAMRRMFSLWLTSHSSHSQCLFLP